MTAAAPAHGSPHLWSVLPTSEFLKERGFKEYAIHFEDKEYNGEALLWVDKDDVEGMPIKDTMWQKAFLRMIARLHEEYPEA